MTFLNWLRSVWLERSIRVLSVDLARGRDILTDLQESYTNDRYNTDLHYAIISQRNRLDDLEDRRNLVQSRLSALSCASSSP